MILTLTNYAKLSNEDKVKYLEEQFEQYSVSALAEKMGTYPNKIRREAKRLGVSVKNQSEIRSMLIEQGAVKSPTEGRKRTKDERIRIGKTRKEKWTKDAKEKIAKKSKELWEQKSEQEKREFLAASKKALRKSLQYGSKVERVIYEYLADLGIEVQRHRKFLIDNKKMSVDLFLPDKETAIEIDGPSHQLPIWGQEKLEKSQRIDQRKDGLLRIARIKIIRVKFNTTLYLNDYEFIKQELKKSIESGAEYSIINVHNNVEEN